MKRILLLTMLLAVMLCTLSSCTSNPPEKDVVVDGAPSESDVVVSQDAKVSQDIEASEPLAESNYVWHDFSGIILDKIVVDGVTCYRVYEDTAIDLPIDLVLVESERSIIDDFEVGDSIRFFVYDEENKTFGSEVERSVIEAEIVLKVVRMPTVFYAEILSVNDDFLHVKGLDINDINYRGEFQFSIGNASLMWRGTALQVSDFDVGDTIAVYYSGETRETEPAGIDNVSAIVLLDDEK